MRRLRLAGLIAAGLAAWSSGGHAQAPIQVDLELVLAVDVSRSMNARELEIQRRGYVAALTSDAVAAAIANGPIGRIALTYVEWAEAKSQRAQVGWTLIAGKADAEAFVARLGVQFEPNLRMTSISGAIDFAAGLFDGNGFDSPRQVIDISGDGPSNDGRPVTHARDDAVADGLTINGLPLMTREGVGGRWYLDDLDVYYTHCVIGGPDAFVVPVKDWSDFPAAIQRKLILELSGLRPPAVLAARPARLWRTAAGGYDCRIADAVWGPPSWYRNKRQ